MPSRRRPAQVAAAPVPPIGAFRLRNDGTIAHVPAASEGVAGPALTDGAEDVGQRVRELRERRGLSLSELARRAAVGKATLSGLEAGTRNPPLETLQAGAAA